mmetsp:Transcript_23727/g.51829  ORF Transcript_23727/g.51829 Transcript_23727/m.51829 type:complete len:244 (+) Transcript_23727:141-872(+)
MGGTTHNVKSGGAKSSAKQRPLSDFFKKGPASKPKVNPAPAGVDDTPTPVHPKASDAPKLPEVPCKASPKVSHKRNEEQRALGSATDDTVGASESQEPAAKKTRVEKDALVKKPPREAPSYNLSEEVARVPPSDPEQHARFQKKLTWQDLSRRGRSRRGEDGERNENDEASGDASAGAKGSDSKDTPLEKQVVELKRKHPGVLLLIEVGYKYHCYGSDAEVAARVLHICCYQARKFLSASFPT